MLGDIPRRIRSALGHGLGKKPTIWHKQPKVLSKTACLRAEALNSLYGTDQSSSCPFSLVHQAHLEFLPLAKAVARFIGMERHLAGGHCQSIEPTPADLHTIKKIVSSASQIFEGHETVSKAARRGFRIVVLLTRIIHYQKRHRAVPHCQWARRVDSFQPNPDAGDEAAHSNKALTLETSVPRNSDRPRLPETREIRKRTNKSSICRLHRASSCPTTKKPRVKCRNMRQKKTLLRLSEPVEAAI